jgi:hypothetical protein
MTKSSGRLAGLSPIAEESFDLLAIEQVLDTLRSWPPVSEQDQQSQPNSADQLTVQQYSRELQTRAGRADRRIREVLMTIDLAAIGLGLFLEQKTTRTPIEKKLLTADRAIAAGATGSLLAVHLLPGFRTLRARAVARRLLDERDARVNGYLTELKLPSLDSKQWEHVRPEAVSAAIGDVLARRRRIIDDLQEFSGTTLNDESAYLFALSRAWQGASTAREVQTPGLPA